MRLNSFLLSDLAIEWCASSEAVGDIILIQTSLLLLSKSSCPNANI